MPCHARLRSPEADGAPAISLKRLATEQANDFMDRARCSTPTFSPAQAGPGQDPGRLASGPLCPSRSQALWLPRPLWTTQPGGLRTCKGKKGPTMARDGNGRKGSFRNSSPRTAGREGRVGLICLRRRLTRDSPAGKKHRAPRRGARLHRHIPQFVCGRGQQHSCSKRAVLSAARTPSQFAGRW